MTEVAAGADRLVRDVDPERDHLLGVPAAAITLVEYGSYVCSYCHTAHDVVRRLRDRFGDRMRYVYRHMPLTDRHEATLAAELVEYAAVSGGEFWQAHDLLMRRGPTYADGELDAMGEELGLPPREAWDEGRSREAEARVRDDARGGLRSGVRVTPTFFINGRRYEGAWDETSLAEAMFRSMGHRLHAASVDFARWAPATGLLLLLMTVVAVAVSNTAFGPSFLAFWDTPASIGLGGLALSLPLLDWVNHGLLTVFFLVVGLEIKRELTVGRLATPKAAAFPIAAAMGGMAIPALIYLLLAPPEFAHGWGATIATDTAFAIALLVVLGDRVPVDLRVFLTAAVIADDLVAIVVVALFYSGDIALDWLTAAGAVTAALVTLNRWKVYRPAPYALLGVILWVTLHEAGIHATLAGVILAAVTPTMPPADLRALLAQAQAVIDAERRLGGEALVRTGPSDTALRALDAIHQRVESPASKLLRAVEPWSSYFVLPVFALANAGVVWSAEVVASRGELVAALAVGLVVGKLAGIFLGARLAVALRVASKPRAYTWRQVAGTGALGGVGFTMSLFIAHQSFTGDDFSAAKIAIFLASLAAGVLGTALLWKRASLEESSVGAGVGEVIGSEVGAAADRWIG
jgi:NhaA family Na+:H+ antiporter